ncbi:cationic peroxidase 1-like [Hibiscus syriacus]|uniref:cationic peroxidase 1-like n=1 Tax=Hibiscus syriacus TaxID=106335 RepID=UPI0019231358|nr:cationic peroxidase 1-like [Hibiscus syriacus]
MEFHSYYLNLCVFFMLIFCGPCSASADYYSKTCPKALSIISAAVYGAVAKESRMGASLLRLHFHDCFVNGCDASILLDDDDASSFTGEKSAGPNANSLRGFEVIDGIKAKLETACPGVVSCADILAVSARYSVAALGGPTWTVQLGRRDSTTASFSSANTDLASPLMNLDELISLFSRKGFNAKEMVALSGSHTTGQARCLLFRNRIYNETNIDSTFAKSIQSDCPSSGGGDNLSPLDDGSAVIFDNSYFKNLVDNKGLLHSDQQLFNGGSTDSQVTTYSNNPITFKADFADAMVKMGNMSLLTGTAGQIRTNCRKVN